MLGDPAGRVDATTDYGDSYRWAFTEAVEAAFAVGDLQMVRRQLASAATGFSAPPPPLMQAHALRFGARLDAREGRDAEVVRASLAAIAMFDQRQMSFWLAVTRLELAEWMLQRGRRDEADALLAPARETFVELAATPWIERVDGLTVHAGATIVDRQAQPA